MPKEYRNWSGPVPRKLGFVAGFLSAAILVSSFVLPNSTHAQSLPAGVPDILNQIQRSMGQETGGLPGITSTTGTTNLPSSTTLQPVSPGSQPPLPPSRLEEIMSARAGARLQQFGYNQLGRGSPVTIPETGAVQDDYILGPGDEIIVSLRGQENNEIRANIDRNGQVVLPRLSPISASGRTFGSFRQDLEAAVHRAYVATNASVSVGRVRQISVLVSGEVNSPGQRLLTGLSSVVDAVLLSGGVKKTGSLRDIRIQRGNREFTIDLYGVLTAQGTPSPFRLADGDRIIVTSLGKTVAVTGLVRQPGIYELAPRQSLITANSLLELAGGLEVRGNYRLAVMRIDEEGRSNMDTLASPAGIIHDSEILFAQLRADQTTSQAILSGGVGLAGNYPVATGTKLSDVIKEPGALGTEPYTLFGIISRKDPRTLLRALVAFTPVSVLNGNEDQVLQSDDIIHPFTLKEARMVASTIRIYVAERDKAEQTLVNPLSVISNEQPSAIQTGNNGTTSPPQSGSTAGLLETSRLSASELAQDEEARIQLIGSLTQRELDMVASGQVRVADFRYMPESNRDLGTQAVYLPMSSDQTSANANGAQQTPQLPNGVSSSGRYGQGLPVPIQQTQAYDQNGQPIPQNNNGGASNYYGEANRPPAPNFQEEPTTPGVFPNNREAPTFNALAQQLGVDPLVLLNFVIDHQVTLDGAVRGPGSYFVGPGTSLKDLVEAAGGTVNWADNSGVELISTAVDSNSGRSVTQRVQLPLQQGLLASYIVRPHDGFRFNQVYSDGNIGNVSVQGEVRYTGNYRITRGEHLSDVLAQAGGLTSTAYPYGTIFLRKSAADKERQGYIRAANEVEDQLVVAMTRIGNDKIDATTFASMQTFVSQLRSQPVVGRISIIADPSILAAKPEMDPLLEPGDVVYIPQRPNTITVLGQVSQPGNFPYRSGLTMADYISQAGGYSSTSDESMTFIVLPDGSARKVQNSWFSYDDRSLPPGSTIVVPRDVTPLDTRQVILDISSIFSQLAVSAASLAVLSTVQ
jgi:protein involved in polysaccharide export with SLBB domain